MISRRSLLVGIAAIVLASGVWTVGAYRASITGAEARLARRSSVIDTHAGALEYAVGGHGPPLMMIHGTGGGFDQGLLFAHAMRESGFQIVAPSPTAYEAIEVPTRILSCEDDLFGTADTARRLAERIPEAALTIWPEGGHIWLGHDADVARKIAAFVEPRS